MSIDVKAGAVVPVLVSLTRTQAAPDGPGEAEQPPAAVPPPRPEAGDVDALVDRELGSAGGGPALWALGTLAAVAVVSTATAGLLAWRAGVLDEEGRDLVATAVARDEAGDITEEDYGRDLRQAQDRHEEGALRRNVALGLGALAVVATGGGLYLWLSSPAAREEAEVAVRWGPGLVAVQWGL